MMKSIDIKTALGVLKRRFGEELREGGIADIRASHGDILIFVLENDDEVEIPVIEDDGCFVFKIGRKELAIKTEEFIGQV